MDSTKGGGKSGKYRNFCVFTGLPEFLGFGFAKGA